MDYCEDPPGLSENIPTSHNREEKDKTVKIACDAENISENGTETNCIVKDMSKTEYINDSEEDNDIKVHNFENIELNEFVEKNADPQNHSEAVLKRNLNINYEESFITDTTDSNFSPKIAKVKKMSEKSKLELRPYQKEYSQPAWEGKNTLIFAPTGTGKTHIAMGIIENHLENFELENKVAMIVPTVTLVEQQVNKFKTFLSQYSSEIIGSK